MNDKLIDPKTRKEHFFIYGNPANIYMFKVNKKNTRKRCAICSNNV